MRSISAMLGSEVNYEEFKMDRCNENEAILEVKFFCSDSFVAGVTIIDLNNNTYSYGNVTLSTFIKLDLINTRINEIKIRSGSIIDGLQFQFVDLTIRNINLLGVTSFCGSSSSGGPTLLQGIIELCGVYGTSCVAYSATRLCRLGFIFKQLV